MIQNYILLFFEYNLQEESTPGSSRKAPEKAYPASHFSAVLSVQKARGTVFLLFLLKYVCAILQGGNAVFSLRPPIVPAFSEYLR